VNVVKYHLKRFTTGCDDLVLKIRWKYFSGKRYIITTLFIWWN